MIDTVVQGVFKTLAELNEYERMWHAEVYQLSWNEQATKVSHTFENLGLLRNLCVCLCVCV